MTTVLHYMLVWISVYMILSGLEAEFAACKARKARKDDDS
jgi:hypothetical protein